MDPSSTGGMGGTGDDDSLSNIVTLLPEDPTIEDANGNQDNLDLMMLARDKMVEMVDYMDRDGWELTHDEDEAQMYTLSHEEFTIVSLLRVFTFNCSFEKAKKFFTDYDNLMKTDEKIIQLDIIEEIGKNTKLRGLTLFSLSNIFYLYIK